MMEFESTGARAAHELAQKAAGKLHHALDFLENQDAHDEQVQPYLLGALSDVDACALERPRHGRLNWVFLVGSLCLMASYVVRLAVMSTSPWTRFAEWATSLV